jgi:hypothetical protein
MTGTIRFAALLLLLARAAAAQLTTAEVYHRVDIAVSVASGAGGGASDSFKLPPTTIPVSGTGGETLPLKVVHADFGGIADASVFLTWSISPTSINASAELTGLSTATIPNAAASGFDQSFSITFQVGAPTTYRLTGSLRTSTQLDPNHRLTCAFNQTPMAGADPTKLPPSAEVPLAREGLVYPGETASIDCGVIGSTAFTDSANQRWGFQVELTPASTEPTTTTTIPKKACKQSCKQAKVECRAACPETGKERRACRKDCKRRAKRCGQSTGCALPVE